MESIKILCFGDSLTEGYSCYGSVFTPYADDMKAFLEASWPSSNVSVEVDGKSGDLVTSPGSFLRRIKVQFSDPSSPYTWVVVLGGTNDLAICRQPDVIFESLRSVYQIALDHGANVLALTVPECASNSRSLDESRGILNRYILQYNAQKFHALDLHTLMPYHSLSNSEKSEIWDDGLHLTPYGYNVMGDYIAQQLVELVPTEVTENGN